MSSLDQITTIEVGLPGPSGAGITSAEKTSFDSRLDALEASVGVIVKDESSALTGQGTTLAFVGAGVTASGSGSEKTITIPGGTLTVQSGDSNVDTGVTTLDFNSTDFTVTSSPSGEANVVRAKFATIFARQTKDSSFSAVSTSLATMDSVEIGPLASGVVYDIHLLVHMRGGPDSSGYLRAYARIAGDASVAGERTGTVAGERSVIASASKLNVTGDGVTTYTLYARAEMDTGTGTVSSSHIDGMAIPR